MEVFKGQRSDEDHGNLGDVTICKHTAFKSPLLDLCWLRTIRESDQSTDSALVSMSILDVLLSTICWDRLLYCSFPFCLSPTSSSLLR